jgi:phosphatidylinositol kinase/protein kinase (PI-3  family)
MQLIYFYLEVFQKEKLDLWVQPYRILSTSKTTGLIQVIDDVLSGSVVIYCMQY